MKQILSKQELDHLSHVISEVESHTVGELRLIIAGSSSQQGYVFPLLSFILFSVFLVLVYVFEAHYWPQFAEWSVLAAAALALILSWLLVKIERVKRLLLMDVDPQVWSRAELEFHREGLDGTKAATGILIFVSLLEHRAVVLADKAIAAKLKPEVWNDVVKLVIHGGKSGEWQKGLESAIRACGELLKTHFPATDKNPNELPNHVLIKP